MPKFSEEHKKKISIARKKTNGSRGKPAWNRGKIGFLGGSKHYNWKGGIATYERKLYLNNRRRSIKMNAGGYHTQGEWENLKAQYNWKCPACKRQEPDIKLTEDHIVPLSRGGSDNIENIQPLCKSCNSKKMCKIVKY